MRNTPSLPSLPGPLRPGVVAPNKGPIYGLNKTKPWFLEFTVFGIWTAYLCWTELLEVELFWYINCVLMLNLIIWNEIVLILTLYCQVSWGCRIHRLHLCTGVRSPPTSDTKQSDGEVTVMLEHWGMSSTPPLPLLPGPLRPGIVAPDRALSMV